MSDRQAILVIDDDAGDRALCQRALKGAFGERWRVREAVSGENGLDAIEKHTPVCVLLDHSLPGINGIEVLKRIRAKHPYLPVIMIDGKGNDVIAVQSMKEGAQDYIVKSTITPPILLRSIQFAINHCAMKSRSDEQRASSDIFTRALAHDLKEPVRTIRSFLDRITDFQNLCEKSRESLDYIQKAADRMNALIDTVYLYTRLDGVDEMERIPCDISGVLKEVQENLGKLISERGATITCDLLPQVQANHVQMIQLFQNLVANAIHHCNAAVTIHVSAQESGDRWRFVVCDNGPGIIAEHFETIFDPFRRFSQSKERGLGLGLAINRKIVESHDGKIWCESRLGAGSSFLFTLPKTTTESAIERRASSLIASPNPQPAGTTRKLARILLVDDNAADILLNRIMLIEASHLTCEVLTACNGREALATLQAAALQRDPIDLVLLDINMPIMDGFELLAEINKEGALPRPVVIMCTTSASDVDQRKAVSLGAGGYLTKPPQFSLFKDIIDESGRLALCQEGDDYVLRCAA
jgi:signal transduction histidine kinase